MPIHFYKCFSLLLAPLAFTVSMSAVGGLSVSELMERGRQLQEAGHSQASEVPLQAAPAVDDQLFQEYKQIGKSLRQRGGARLSQKRQQRPEDGRCNHAVTVIAVSRSLGDKALAEIFAGFSGRQNASIAFRGVPEGQKIGASLIKLQKLAMKHNPMPSVQLDPTIFRDHNIKSVPEILYLGAGKWGENGCRRPLVARVQGVTSPEFIFARIESGDDGDFGVRGPTELISEPDLIAVMQAKVKTIDWDQKVSGAKRRMWDNVPLVTLPPATNTQRRQVDASVVATQDILAQDGSIIVPAGKRVNPLSMRPWTQSLIVFDPLDIKQKEIALWQAEKARAKNLKPVPFITQYDSSRGVDLLNELASEFGTQVFVLSPDIRSRFHLSVSPSVVTANQSHFIIDEIHQMPIEGEGDGA